MCAKSSPRFPMVVARISNRKPLLLKEEEFPQPSVATGTESDRCLGEQEFLQTAHAV